MVRLRWIPKLLIKLGGTENLLDVLKECINFHYFRLIAIYTLAEVWVSYSEYTTSESHLDGGILHLRYENDIPMINRFSRIVVRWRYQSFHTISHHLNILYIHINKKPCNLLVNPHIIGGII